MAKKVLIIPPRKAGRSITDEKLKGQLEDKHLKKMEKIRHSQAEHKKHVELEESLRQLQLLQYEPVDYLPLLEETPWTEPPVTSYEFLKSEAIQRVENVYRERLMLYGGGFVAIFLFFLLMPRPIALVMFLANGVFLVFLTSKTLEQKQVDLIKALEEAQYEIYRRQEEDRNAHEEARKQHEFAERLRVGEVQAVLEGKVEAVAHILKEKLEGLKLPVYLEGQVEIGGPVLRISVLLPNPAVIPKQWSKLLNTGHIEYEDKQDRELAKEYAELVTGLLVHIGIKICETAPSISIVYIIGIGEMEQTLMHMKLSREMLKSMGNRPVISSLLKGADVVYFVDNQYTLLPVDAPGDPEEWEENQDIYKTKVKVLQKA
jgi:hypothetical protein